MSQFPTIASVRLHSFDQQLLRAGCGLCACPASTDRICICMRTFDCIPSCIWQTEAWDQDDPVRLRGHKMRRTQRKQIVQENHLVDNILRNCICNCMCICVWTEATDADYQGNLRGHKIHITRPKLIKVVNNTLEIVFVCVFVTDCICVCVWQTEASDPEDPGSLRGHKMHRTQTT